MAKNTQTTKTETQATEQVGFLAQLQTLATPITDLSEVAIKKDPIANAKLKFAQNADEMCKLIKAAAESGKWFSKKADCYVVTFRNGNSAMKIDGKTEHWKVADAAGAVLLIEAVKAAASKGDLDEAFKASQRAPKGSKAAAPAPQPA